jgi:allophanate hydrolase
MTDLIELVVVGAHMTGMALNGELTALGGAFSRAVKTTADYRLFALNGAPPKRPGLLRIADGRGVSIDVEVWLLPREAFGAFVASIPAPLCIGTVRLSDGTAPKGFLVEPQGIVDATDISALRGWRAFVNGTHAPAL